MPSKPAYRGGDQGAIDDALGQKARMSNNVCPLCWMPLGIGGIEDAGKWKRVQVVFKGKPAFSIKNPGIRLTGQVFRPVTVFGINKEVDNFKSENFQNCHYIHASMFGNAATLKNIWTVVSLDNPAAPAQHQCDFLIPSNAVKFSSFYKRLNEQSGIFAGTDALTSALIGKFNEPSCRWGDFRTYVQSLHNQVFAGCVDCNLKMTISKFVDVLFNLVFPINTYSQAAFNTEGKIHYLMLGGLLRDDELEPNSLRDENVQPREKIMFKITEVSRKNSWSLRCMMMWCTLQVLFCKWTIASTSEKIRHHVEYIFVGVMDFYISLWLYALCLVNFEIDSSITGFEQFHYYYISCYSFFKNPQSQARNISTFVLQNETEWKHVTNLQQINQQILQIYQSMFNFWDKEMIYLARYIMKQPTLLSPQEEQRMNSFFTHPDFIQQKTDSAPRILTIKAYEDHLGPQWYWFHFKQITIPRIRARCRDFDGVLSRKAPPTSAETTGIWRAWFHRFDARVRALGSAAVAPPGAVRAVLNGGGRLVRS